MRGEPDLDGLLEAMAEVLGQGVDADTDFFAAGGDSLRAAELFASLEHRYGRRWPDSLLVAEPTPAGLLPLLRDAGHHALVPVQPTGRRPPLVVVFPAHGVVHGVRRLSALLGPDQPVLGLQPSDPQEARRDPAAQVTDEAVALVTAALDGRSCTVLGLAGACFAAHRLVQRIEGSGRPVRFLAVLAARPWPIEAAAGPVAAPLLALSTQDRRTESADWAALTSAWSAAVPVPGRSYRVLHEPAVRVVARELVRAGLLVDSLRSG